MNFRNFLIRTKFWINFPFAIIAFKWRERKAWHKIIPRRWLSPSKVIEDDLALYAGEAPEKFDLKFIEDFAKARDETLGTAKKQLIFSSVVFLFLASNYFGFALDINVGGFSLKSSPGVPEGLLLISNLLSCYTLILQANAAVLDATIKAAIKFGAPEELRLIYLVRYFPHEQFGRYQPFNMPYLIPSKLQRALGKWVAISFLSILAVTFLAYAAFNGLLLVHYLWIKSSFGIWSKLLFGYIAICGLTSIFYVALTRFRLPYLDYTINNELELLEQINPQRHGIRLQEIYGEMNKDRRNMEWRGYLKPRQQA